MMRNWKTSLSGLLGFLLSVPIFVQAIEDLANHKPVNWILVVLGCAIAFNSHGLLQAKDATTHSTIAEIEKASAPVAKQTS